MGGLTPRTKPGVAGSIPAGPVLIGAVASVRLSALIQRVGEVDGIPPGVTVAVKPRRRDRGDLPREASYPWVVVSVAFEL